MSNTRKSLVIFATQLADGVLLKILKYFEICSIFLTPSSCEKLKNLDWYMQTSFHESSRQ